MGIVSSLLYVGKSKKGKNSLKKHFFSLVFFLWRNKQCFKTAADTIRDRGWLLGGGVDEDLGERALGGCGGVVAGEEGELVLDGGGAEGAVGDGDADGDEAWEGQRLEVVAGAVHHE